MNRKKNVLIVGGTGFIGFHLCNFFLKKIIKFLVFLLIVQKNRKLKKVKYYCCNIGILKEIIFLKKMNFDYVVNSGGYVIIITKKYIISSLFWV